MRLRLLGTAAGGGLPQWNCRCANCQAARTGSIEPRAECSLAFSPDGAAWYLINATPDLTRSLARWPELSPQTGIRSSPVRGIILTDGELDHVMGLLHLREGARWTLYATPVVAGMLEANLHLLPALRRYADVPVIPLSLDHPLIVGPGAGGGQTGRVEVRVVETGRRLPRYAGASAETSEGAVVAAVLTNLSTGRRAVYAPGVPRLSESMARACAGADVVFFDGTFWDDAELSHLDITRDTATSMGHAPVGGPEGSAVWLSRQPAETKLYVHLNNTNPLLNASGSERTWIRGLGIDVADDGWEAIL
jgi:pyrroloquinoline quinone biosynthesis protein B